MSILNRYRAKLPRLRQRYAAGEVDLQQYRRWRRLYLKRLAQMRYVPPPPRPSLREKLDWLLFGKKNTRRRKQWIARKYRLRKWLTSRL